MAEKKNVVTYSGLKKIEEELQDLKVNKRREIAAKIKEARESREICQRMQSTMQQRMSRETSRRGSNSSRQCLRILRS